MGLGAESKKERRERERKKKQWVERGKKNKKERENFKDSRLRESFFFILKVAETK